MSQFGSAEKLMDPIALAAESGAGANYDLGSCAAFRVKRDPTSAGVLRYIVTTVDDSTPTDASAGYALTEDDPDSGWIPADASRILRVHGDGGAVVGECARLRRV